MPKQGNNERTPLQGGEGKKTAAAHSSFMSDYSYFSSDDDGDDFDDDDSFDEEETDRLEMRKADRLSRRLLAVDDDDHVQVDRILRKSLRLNRPLENQQQQTPQQPQLGFYPTDDPRGGLGDVSSSSSSPFASPQFRPIGKMSSRNSGRFRNMLEEALVESQEKARRKIFVMLGVALACLVLVIALAYVEVKGAQPPQQPVGPYVLLERQEGDEFFKAYEFYEGPDSVGSNGYNNYVSQSTAERLGIINITYEDDELDVYGRRRGRRRLNGEPIQDGVNDNDKRTSPISEPFVYMRTAPTPDGPRQSIRLEGIRRFNRGLFIIDIRHMPTGCGVWPAFWLTDEANWPVNGEIDIVEGVNNQTEAKTALHSTQGCSMFDIPLGTMTGGWDTAIGIPNADTGIPDMTMRYAKNCFVYDQHQWLNQGCVAVDLEGGTLGQPLNDKGGGVYALEWDPINRHIRSWVFTPHEAVPDNLIDAIRTAHFPASRRVAPDPQQWPLPYGYFSIGVGTDCPESHFKHMRIVFNTAFCGSVAGNRFFMDCPAQFKKHKTCNEYIKSEPEALLEAYWKIRGVYVYERAWEKQWLD